MGSTKKNNFCWIKRFRIIHEGSEVFRMIGSLVLSAAWCVHPRDSRRKKAYCTVNQPYTGRGSNSDSRVTLMKCLYNIQ